MRFILKKYLTSEQANFILDNVSEGIFTIDRDFKITYFNSAAEQLTKILFNKAIGKHCHDVMRTDICESNCLMKTTFESGNPIRLKHINILRPDGSQIVVSVNTSTLINNEGQIIGGVVTFRDLSALEELKKEIKQKYTIEDFVTKNHKVLQLLEMLPNIAESDCTVLIQGPSGTGKEMFARAIHNRSTRNNNPFMAINCGALPETLLESELFGYVKGAFTDAKKDKPGRFELAKGGTFFFDEIESLPMSIQVKLLRVLQEREYEPLGATFTEKADVRVIAASKTDLSILVAKDMFRDDLFYRINVIKLELPPLKERRDDIPLLIEHFIEKYNKRMDRNIVGISDQVKEILLQYDYPGNVRQLENVMEHSFVMCRSTKIKLDDLPPEISTLKPQKKNLVPNKPIKNAEYELILATLRQNNYNKILTAKALGLHRSTLWRKMKRYHLL